MPRFNALLTGSLLFVLCHVNADAQTVPPADKEAWMKANGHYDSGNFLLKSKKFTEAAEKYRAAIALYPGDWHYHYNLALALKHAGRGAEAVTEFRESLKINPSDWKSWKALGNTYWRLQQKTEAKDAFENALKHGAPPNEAKELHAGIAACSP